MVYVQPNGHIQEQRILEGWSQLCSQDVEHFFIYVETLFPSQLKEYSDRSLFNHGKMKKTAVHVSLITPLDRGRQSLLL